MEQALLRTKEGLQDNDRILVILPGNPKRLENSVGIPLLAHCSDADLAAAWRAWHLSMGARLEGEPRDFWRALEFAAGSGSAMPGD